MTEIPADIWKLQNLNEWSNSIPDPLFDFDENDQIGEEKAPKELKTIKFQMMLSEREAKALDDYRFSKRFGSRAQAIRYLCGLSLAGEHGAYRRENETLKRQLAEASSRIERMERTLKVIGEAILSGGEQ